MCEIYTHTHIFTISTLSLISTIDVFEHYFFQEEPDALVENLNLKTLALFKDVSDEARTISKIGWHPEGPTKIIA